MKTARANNASLTGSIDFSDLRNTIDKLLASNLRVDHYKALSECVESGISYGWQRAHKHTDKPSVDVIKSAIYDAVMLEISEKYKFD